MSAAVTSAQPVGGAHVWDVDGLGRHWQVRCGPPEVAALLGPVLASLTTQPDDGEDAAESLVVDRAADGEYVVRAGQHEARYTHPAAVLDRVQWQINAWVIDAMHQRGTGLHAAAVRRSDTTVVLPAPSGTGKSTLVTGLVRAGWQYVSDEAVELGSHDVVRGLRKAITLQAGAQRLFADLAPPYPVMEAWHVPPTHVGEVETRRWSDLTHVVLPRWSGSAAATVERLTPSRALMGLAPCTFYFSSDGQRHLARLARLVRHVPVWSMSYADCESGLELIEEITQAPAVGDVGGEAWRPAEPLPAGAIAEVFPDGVVAFAASTGTLHRLDPLACLLWSRLSRAGVAEVVSTTAPLSGGTAHDAVRRDIERLQHRLLDVGLLSGPADG